MTDDIACAPAAIRLKYAGKCRVCGTTLGAATLAVYDRSSKTVTCSACAADNDVAKPAHAGDHTHEDSSAGSAEPAAPMPAKQVAPEPDPAPEPEIFAGVAGASARLEGKRRSEKREALAKSDLPDVSVTGMLCFVEADWPLFGGDFATAGIKVLWPKKAVEHIRKPGLIDEAAAKHIFRTLAQAFPVAKG